MKSKKTVNVKSCLKLVDSVTLWHQVLSDAIINFFFFVFSLPRSSVGRDWAGLGWAERCVQVTLGLKYTRDGRMLIGDRASGRTNPVCHTPFTQSIDAAVWPSSS
ncbi:hypothetical protein DAPPUDRAFT_94295 [Daphnia pulex]|uniref:Uncharacterized protein n=1 Tax=Daphnia pulex TaxID=6669 RepID=E9FQZ6_DAPPU|nr:hypothetical protein DAPPUDRAFT_94295 [Daphnia pulex]|eukprot:EFX90279.1 hypothetical protein DAPPUDRAFT_94295 [Daphnia pulex]